MTVTLPREPSARSVWRHEKRGTTYTVVGLASAQVVGEPITEGAEAVVYRSDSDGSLWLRPIAEFMDGRFARLPPAALPDDVVERAHFAVHWDDERLTAILERLAAPGCLYVIKFVEAGIAIALQHERDAAHKAAVEACAQIAERYSENPPSAENNNTQSAFDQGMDHMAGVVDCANWIRDAIRALAQPAPERMT